MVYPRYYILAIYIADRPYKIREGLALELLQTDRWNLEQRNPNSVYRIMSIEQFNNEKEYAVNRLAKREEDTKK
ncbi:hypothetical protein [Staphylococcus phage SpP]